MNDDVFWDHLLGHIDDRRLVPLVGPELTIINTGDAEQTFSSLIGQRLSELTKKKTLPSCLPILPSQNSSGDTVLFLRLL